MEILNNFGFEPILFVAQIVNFLIIFALLKKFLYKPMLKMLEERKNKISKGIKDAEESARLLEETVQREEKILKTAQEKAKHLMDEAKSQSDIMLKQSEEETKKKVDKLLSEAREQIKYETGVAQQNLEVNISKIAINYLETSLNGLFEAKDQEVIMKRALKKIKKVD